MLRYIYRLFQLDSLFVLYQFLWLLATMVPSVLTVLVLAAVASADHIGVLNKAIPSSGSVITGDANDIHVPKIFCEVYSSNGTALKPQATVWHIAGEGRPMTEWVIINSNNKDFNITGDVLGSGITINYGTNLSIVQLKPSLDRKTLYCGISREVNIANFTLKLYRPPDLTQGGMKYLLEGEKDTVSVSAVLEAFPPAQDFQWSKDGRALTSSQRVSPEHTSVTFDPVQRGDTGLYTLTAVNYKCAEKVLIPPRYVCSSTDIIGSGDGSVQLEVLYYPSITPGKRKFAVSEGGTITLICGSNPNGNPRPTIQWRDSRGVEVSVQGSRFSLSSDRLRLTITNARTDDAGIWLCILTGDSIKGLLQHRENISVSVVVRPDPPENVLVLLYNATWAVVRWSSSSPSTSYYRVTSVQLPGMVFSTSNMSINVTGLQPATEYQFTVRAIAMSQGVMEVSEPSQPSDIIQTVTTVPAVVCDSVPLQSSYGVITVRWSYIHTGGLDLTDITVRYKNKLNSLDDFQIIPAETISVDQFEVEIRGFLAGETYIFRVEASNALGSQSVDCPPLSLLIGIPQPPNTPWGISRQAGEIVLALSTREAGTGGPLDSVEFVVNASHVLGSNSRINLRERFENYEDGNEVEFAVGGLAVGEWFTFTAATWNMFGKSEISNKSNQIQVGGNSTMTAVQLVFLGLEQQCPQWVEESKMAKLRSISVALQRQMENWCTCNFTTLHITAEAFHCAESESDSHSVTFRAQVFGTQHHNSSVLVRYIEEWINSDNASVVVLNMTLDIDTACPLVTNLTEPLCHKSAGTGQIVTIASVVSTIAVLFLVLASVLLIASLYFVRKRKHIKDIRKQLDEEESQYSRPIRHNRVSRDTTQKRESKVRYTGPVTAVSQERSHQEAAEQEEDYEAVDDCEEKYVPPDEENEYESLDGSFEEERTYENISPEHCTHPQSDGISFEVEYIDDMPTTAASEFLSPRNSKVLPSLTHHAPMLVLPPAPEEKAPPIPARQQSITRKSKVDVDAYLQVQCSDDIIKDEFEDSYEALRL